VLRVQSVPHRQRSTPQASNTLVLEVADAI
jgi:hypothetical protein